MTFVFPRVLFGDRISVESLSETRSFLDAFLPRRSSNLGHRIFSYSSNFSAFLSPLCAPLRLFSDEMYGLFVSYRPFFRRFLLTSRPFARFLRLFPLVPFLSGVSVHFLITLPRLLRLSVTLATTTRDIYLVCVHIFP